MTAAGKRGDDLQAGRHGADHVDALQVHQLAQLLEAQLDLAAGNQRADRNARRRLDEALAERLGDVPALEEPLQRDAARAGRIANASGRQQRLPGADGGPRRALAPRDGDARAREIGLAAGEHLSRRDELVDRVGGQHDDVELLAVVHPPGGLDAAHRVERDRGAAAPCPDVGHPGQDLAGGHRGDAGERGAHGLAPAASATHAGLAMLSTSRIALPRHAAAGRNGQSQADGMEKGGLRCPTRRLAQSSVTLAFLITSAKRADSLFTKPANCSGVAGNSS